MVAFTDSVGLALSNSRGERAGVSELGCYGLGSKSPKHRRTFYSADGAIICFPTSRHTSLSRDHHSHLARHSFFTTRSLPSPSPSPSLSPSPSSSSPSILQNLHRRLSKTGRRIPAPTPKQGSHIRRTGGPPSDLPLPIMAPNRTLSTRPRASNASLRSSYTSRSNVSNTNPKPRLDVLPQLTPTRTHFEDGIITVKYEEARSAKPPIPVTVAPPRFPPEEEHPAFRRDRSAWGGGSGGAGGRGMGEEEWKRDSGLAPTTTSSRGKRGVEGGSFKSGLSRAGSVMTERTAEIEVDKEIELDKEIEVEIPAEKSQELTIGPDPPTVQTEEKREAEISVPITPVQQGEGIARSGSRWRRKSTPKTPKQAEELQLDFSPITTDIPADFAASLGEDFENLTFSNRGSVFLSGKKAVSSQARPNIRRKSSYSMLIPAKESLLSNDVQKESQKVRSMYEQDTEFDWEDQHSNIPTMDSDAERSMPNRFLSPQIKDVLQRPTSSQSIKREHELAGGIEDWEDINGLDVDRYGFINKTQEHSGSKTPEAKMPKRVSTVLQLASDAPRKNHKLFGRAPSNAVVSSLKREPSRKVSARSLRTQASSTSQRSTGGGRIRAAANRLPGNQDRRWMDEAGDMLTLPPGLADIAEDEDGGRGVEVMKKKEWERAEKWRKMAKVTKTGKNGEGMEFEFDTKSSKLIERVWKGIPDRWRAAAWHSFLTTSAKKRKEFVADEQIIEAFHKHLPEPSADDVQIDIDVPRTINSHIMFRRRYRGGQRLLFRVLHSLSLYFPNTGYVQGMASLAATLLCYFDEEKTFVMLVRMWTLRGLDKLYESGFLNLMAALDEFQKQWLKGRDVAQKLEELNIEPTAYGTRWYLTLFNYSIPFPAQLRVWDVFMLLGDSDPSDQQLFGGGLDVIHATSAALIDGTREILLDSDFENAMKVLTSWIPVKDEELLMKVAKAEWKLNRKRK